MNNNNKTRNIDNLFQNKHSSLYILCGKSGKGKSHMTKYLLTDGLQSGKFKFGLVFTRTKFNHDYDFLPDDRVLEGYNEQVLEKYVNNLEKMIKKNGSVPPSFLVFEDLVGVLNSSSEWFNNFISKFRHYSINIFICVQYLMGKRAISPIMREQTNFCIMFRSKTLRTLNNLFENFGGLFNSYEEFKEHLLSRTEQEYTACLYVESIDDIESNYIQILAPKDYPKIKFKF